MKIAVTGKGGVGKSTIAAMLAHLAVSTGKNVLAIDSDPDANLAFSLGISIKDIGEIVPLTSRTELIEERTGAKLREFGQIFKLNPNVSDIADKFGYRFRDINLVVFGAIEGGGSGCACPENVFLRNLLSNIIVQREEFVIVDMEAGIEHLGRSTAKSVDLMLAVVEPTPQSIETAKSVRHLAREIGVKKVSIIGNKINSNTDKEFISGKMDDFEVIGYILYSETVKNCDRENIPLIDSRDNELMEQFRHIYKKILQSDS